MFTKFKERLLLILKEVGNFLSNILIPFIGLLILIVEILPLPKSVAALLKKVEYWLFYISGTASKLEENIKDKYQD